MYLLEYRPRKGSQEGQPNFRVKTCAEKSFHGQCCHCFPSRLFASPDQVFGCQLESLCQREGDTVPSFVRLCIAAVDKRGHFPETAQSTPSNRPRPGIPHLPHLSLPPALFLSSLGSLTSPHHIQLRAGILICSLPHLLGLDVDGIYRVSGNLAVVQKLRFLVDRGEKTYGRVVVLRISCLRTTGGSE